MKLELLDQINCARRAAGFLSVEEILSLSDSGNQILDPFSVLISKRVTFGEGNRIYPGVTIQAAGDAEVHIGNGNHFQAGTLLEASCGDIVIGNDNQFGEGGFTAKANQPGARISIGNNGRYVNNPSVFGLTELQDGSQILGNITVVSCILCAGGSHEEPEPDRRAGLLKGYGVAKGLKVSVGQVIWGEGTFDQKHAVPQSTFHSA